MEYEKNEDVLSTLDWISENSKKQELQKTTIYYFALTTCAYCKKGLNWMREKELAFNWLYLDNYPPETKIAIKNWLKTHYERKRDLGMPFVIFRQVDGDFISDGFDPDYWKAKSR